MNMLLRQAIERSRALRSQIGASPVSETAELPPQAFPSETDPPMPAEPPRTFPWFSITDDLGPRKILISQIQRAVAAHFGIKVTDLISARRTRDLIIPRHIAIYLAKELTPRTLPAIGRAFGGRDHSTACNAIRKIAARLDLGDPEVTAAVTALRSQIEAAQCSTATDFSDAVKAGALSRDVTTDGVIATLWGGGFDTKDIARLLMLRESVVANRLAAIRDGER